MAAPETRMPVLFIGHGSPMNAIEDNEATRQWKALGGELPRPKAILCVSAHWFIEGTTVTANERPETIHDFGGFPKPLFEVEYPAPGDPVSARHVAAKLSDHGATVSNEWGLDHGTWSVLVHLVPDADVPVLQLSIDMQRPADEHLRIARDLASLRDEGILIIGSGNVTHNLPDAFARMRRGDKDVVDWAARFDEDAVKAIEARDDAWFAEVLQRPEGRQSHPTPDHFLPLVYAYGASTAEDTVSFPVEAFQWGSLSMRAVAWGFSS